MTDLTSGGSWQRGRSGDSGKGRILVAAVLFLLLFGMSLAGAALAEAPAQTPIVWLPLIMRTWGGAAPTPTPTATVPAGEAVIMAENFEGAFPGNWLLLDGDGAANGDYTWAKRDCLFNAGAHAGWAVGGGANGSALSCWSDYPANAESWMLFGPFSLVGATNARMDFKAWVNTELDVDGVCAYASADAVQFHGICASGNSGGWTDGSLDLTDIYMLGDLTGEPDVYVAFLFVSDAVNTFAMGALVDDIVLRKNVPASAESARPPAGVTYRQSAAIRPVLR